MILKAHSWRRRLSWVTAYLLFLLITAWMIADELTVNEGSARLNAAILQSRLHTAQIDGQVNHTLELLNTFRLSQQQCTAPLYKALSNVVRTSEYVYDAALQMPDGTLCSSYGYPLPKAMIPQAELETHYPDSVRHYWFPRQGDAHQALIVIAHRQAYVWVNEEIFFDALQTPASMVLQFIDAHDGHPVLVKNAVPAAIKPSLKVGELAVAGGYWSLTFNTPWPNLLGVVSLSGTDVQWVWWEHYLLALLGGAQATLVMLYVGGRIYRRYFSFSSKITRAVRRNQMTLHYQPIVDLRTGKWCGAEALLRWNVGEKIISPALIVTEVERCGAIRELTRWVCRRVAEDYVAFFQHAGGHYFTINLSAEDLADLQFVDFVSTLFTQYKVPAAFIVFELTESVLVDKELAQSQLQRLRDLGHRIALDDFGTGYSNLAYLECLPIDILKIDRSFITSSRYREPDAMWRQVLGIAKILRLSVVAEGVESAEQAGLLTQAGVPLAQGWFYSKALSAQQFVQLSIETSDLTSS